MKSCWKRHFVYGRVDKGQNRKSVTDSWKNGDELLDIRDIYSGQKIVALEVGNIDKVYPNRKSALKFAKSYMKKHNRC